MRSNLFMGVLGITLIVLFISGYLRLGTRAEIQLEEQAITEQTDTFARTNGSTLKKRAAPEQKPPQAEQNNKPQSATHRAEIMKGMSDEVKAQAELLSKRDMSTIRTETKPDGTMVLHIDSGWQHTPVAVIGEDGELVITEH